jgi:hypothetical protein
MSQFCLVRRFVFASLFCSLLTFAFESPSKATVIISTVTNVSVEWGTSGTASLSPGEELPWYGINRFEITLSSPASLSASDVSVTGSTIANYGPVSISGSGTNYTITLAQPIDSMDGIVLTLGNAGIATYTDVFDVLPGDVNGDGVVNSADLVDVRNAFSAYNIIDDINGDGVVDITDYGLVKARVGQRLP